MANRKVKNNVDLRVINEEHPKVISSIARFLTKYQDVFGYALVGILILSAVMVLMNYNKNAKNIEASASLQTALKQYQQDLAAASISFKTDAEQENPSPEVKIEAKAAGAFQSVFDNYPGTPSGRNAQYMVAVSHLNTGANDQALEAFDIFLADNASHPLAPSAVLGKATALFNSNRTEESLELLNRIKSDYPVFNLMDVVTFEIAKRYESLEQWDNARKSYQSLIEMFPDSTWKSNGENALKKLEKQHPAESSEEAA